MRQFVYCVLVPLLSCFILISILRDEFRAEPSNTRVALGENTILECLPPRGHPEPTISWRRNGQYIDLDANKRLRLVDGSSLAIHDVRQSDDGRYQCIARNSAASRESAVATLRVHQRPFFIKPPQNAMAMVGTAVEFSCRVGGDPTPDVLWRRAGGNMPLGRVHILEDRSLRLEQVAPGDAGEYSCEADNAVGSVTGSAYLTVHSPPVFSIRPSDQRVEIHRTANFECAATGSPDPMVFWTIEGNRTLLFPGSKLGRFSVSVEGILSLSDAERSDSTLVVCCAAVSESGASNARASLRVTSELDLPPPIILRGPANQTLPLQSDVNLPCEATGFPRPVITWYHEDKPISGSTSRIFVTDSGTLNINYVQKSDAGVYTCVASSRSGKSIWKTAVRLEAPTSTNAVFFRAPEKSNLPGSPGQPVVINRTETTLTLLWATPTKIGASPIIGYQIEYFSRNSTSGQHVGQSTSWITAAKRVPDNTYPLRNLRPGVNYVFLVRAENSHGLSLPSEISHVANTLPSNGITDSENWELEEARATLSGHVVELTQALAVSATQVKLTWEIVTRDYVEGFYIYSHAMPDVADSWTVQTVLQAGASGFVVAELHPATKYTLFLIPFFKTIDGRPSNSRIATTLEDAPSLPPSHLEAILVNTSAVYFKWQPPAVHGQHGTILGYFVIVKGSNASLFLNATVNSTSMLLGDLNAGETYTLQTAAFTKAGAGPFSPAAILRVDTSRLQLLEGQVLAIEPGLGDFVSEPWFLAFTGSMGIVMAVLFVCMLIFRHTHLRKKSVLGNDSSDPRSSASLTPLSAGKPAVGTDSLWIDSRWRSAAGDKSALDPGDGAAVRSSVNNVVLPDYAEVSTSTGLISFQKRESTCSNTTAPYASTTLVSNSRLHGCVQLSHSSVPRSDNMGSVPTRSCPFDSVNSTSGNNLGGYSDSYVTATSGVNGFVQRHYVQKYSTPNVLRDTSNSEIRFNNNNNINRQRISRRNVSPCASNSSEHIEYFIPFSSAPNSSVLPRRQPASRFSRSNMPARHAAPQPDVTQRTAPEGSLCAAPSTSNSSVSAGYFSFSNTDVPDPRPAPPPYFSSKSEYYQPLYSTAEEPSAQNKPSQGQIGVTSNCRGNSVTNSTECL